MIDEMRFRQGLQQQYEIEHNLRRVMATMGMVWESPQIDTPTDDDIRQLVMQNQKIAAIKLYRERYNTGLREAKDAIDAIG